MFALEMLYRGANEHIRISVLITNSLLVWSVQFARIVVDRRVDGERPLGNACHMILPIRVWDAGVKVEVVRCSYLGDGMGRSLIRITDPTGLNGSRIMMNTTGSLMGEYSVTKVSNHYYLAIILNNNCRFAQLIAESGVFMIRAIPYDDYVTEWHLLAPNNMMITKLVERIRQFGYGVEKCQSTNLEAEGTLTPKQYEVLRYAFEKGYYDVPKRISTEELAAQFGLSKSTVSVIIRSAERKVISLFFSQNSDVEDIK